MHLIFNLMALNIPQAIMILLQTLHGFVQCTVHIMIGSGHTITLLLILLSHSNCNLHEPAITGNYNYNLKIL